MTDIGVDAKPSMGTLFWVLAVVALVWHGLGCVNLLQQMTPAGLAGLPEEYQAFIAVRPVWSMIGFAVSVVAGTAGAVLMFLRHKLAAQAFALSCIGALVAMIPTLDFGLMSVIIGTVMSAVIAGVLAWYSRRKLG